VALQPRSFFRAMGLRRFGALVLGLFACAAGLDAESSDCMACNGQSDKECLQTLTSAMGDLSDRDRLAFLRAVFTGSFQMASMLRQTNVDSTTTCASLSDKECLASLDSEFDGLTDKYRLAYLVESCNELQHYSAFAATPVAESGGALSPALGFAAAGLVVAGVAAGVRRSRSRAAAYAPVGDDEIEI